MSEFPTAQRPSTLGRRTPRRRAIWGISGLLAIGTLAAGCGSGSNNPPAAGASGGGSSATVATKSNAQLGTILVNDKGFTLYKLSTDSAGKSSCDTACEQVWPPVVVGSGGTPTAGSGVSGLATITSAGGQQVTYNGMPLYTFTGDSSAGQTNGQNVKDSWGTWTVVVTKAASGGATTTTAGSTGGGGVGF